jgi:hypothetical protein
MQNHPFTHGEFRVRTLSSGCAAGFRRLEIGKGENMHIILATALTAILAVIAASTGIATQLGAHPWWAGQVVMVGAPIGIVLGLALWGLRLNRVLRLSLAVIALAAAFGVAKYGQTGFANSYAEDQLAGKLWFMGWIATSAAVSLLLMARAQTRPQASNESP